MEILSTICVQKQIKPLTARTLGVLRNKPQLQLLLFRTLDVTTKGANQI